MNEQEIRDKEQIHRSSEYIRAAESFARYANQEWVADNADERAMLICCVDKTLREGTGVMAVATGGRDLLTAAVMAMMKDERIGDIFDRARIVSETSGGLDEEISNTRHRLRMLYGSAAVECLWTLFVIVIAVCGIVPLITTVSNLLMMVVVGMITGRNIMESRRMLHRLVAAVRRDREELMKHQLKDFFEALKRSMQDDDDDDD